MAPSRLTPRSAADWGAVMPQWVGMIGLAAQLAFYVVTYFISGQGQANAALLTAFGGLIVGGQGIEALAALRSPPRLTDEPVPNGGP